MSLRRDQRGIGLFTILIIALVGLFGIGILGSLNWNFLLAIMMILVIGLAMVGVVFFKMDFKYVMIISMICLAITLFVTVTPVVIMGFLVAGFAMWKLTPEKHLAMMVALIGLGLLLVVWGTTQLASLGIYP